jgi:carboxyl-terminal processing protease
MKKLYLRTYLPLLLIVAVAVTAFAADNSRDNIMARLTTFSSVLQMVRDYYVEDVDSEELIDAAIRGLLLELDPHSSYLDKERFESVTERHQGEYHGIGIHFDIIEGWLTVISPIEGSPSDNLGLRAGDRIVKINGESARNISNQEVYDKLRGPKGSKVNITVRREGQEEPTDYEITRDKIPIFSVPYSFMVAPGVGYVRCTRFSKDTTDELERALTELEAQGMEKLILDLRDNSGGYLNQAISVTDKFIEGGKILLHTKGRLASASQEYYSTDEATHERYPLIVMISHGSASASEIVSGAVQDWDRGLVVGETSFGKGLVQRQFKMRDGSGLLLTVARYYTPSGRLIQREYTEDRRDYYVEGYRGTADDDTTRPVFYTSKGRKVYGGGGITPDEELEYDRLSTFGQRLARERIAFDFAGTYIAEEGMKAEQFGNVELFNSNYEVSQETLESAFEFMAGREFEYTEEELESELDYLKLSIKAEIAGHLWSTEERYQVFIVADTAVQQAIALLPQAELLASQVPASGDAFQKTGTED